MATISEQEYRDRREAEYAAKMRKQAWLDDDDYRIVVSERNQPNTARRRRSGIAPKYWDATWDDFKVEAHTEPMHKALLRWSDSFDNDMHRGQGFTLLGPPGVGKTMAGCLVGMDLIRAGYLVRFMPLANYVAMQQEQIKLEGGFRNQDGPEANDARARWFAIEHELHIVRNVAHLVVLDDAGKEYRGSGSGYAEDAFDLFLRTRYNLGRPTIVTSNVPIKDWDSVYSPAMQSFIHEATEVISIAKTGDKRVPR